ncbi:MAG: hypothetical protein KTR19_05585 [Hyphomicrobiales bacterium]|nr:hypothetical protein [Hyphomicrobiales bacterium]
MSTRTGRKFTIEANNSAAALEVMSRHAVSPKWLIDLPPTMSPSQTSRRDGLLEHPDEAFSYFRKQGGRQLIAGEKHTGSRAHRHLPRGRCRAGARAWHAAVTGHSRISARTGSA